MALRREIQRRFRMALQRRSRRDHSPQKATECDVPPKLQHPHLTEMQVMQMS